MIFPPLHRHPALQPLSREHFNGLRHARQLTISAAHSRAERQDAVEQFLRAWREEINEHFTDEERLLGDLLEPVDLARLQDEHTQLRRLIAACEAQADDPPADLVQQLGTLLTDHIRWEERHLFEVVQQRARADQIKHIAQETQRIEVLRPGARRRQTGTPGCSCGGADCHPPADEEPQDA